MGWRKECGVFGSAASRNTNEPSAHDCSVVKVPNIRLLYQQMNFWLGLFVDTQNLYQICLPVATLSIFQRLKT